MSGVLEGLLVLDLTRFLSGPYCALLLAGLAAQVIKIDDPAIGEPTASAPRLFDFQDMAAGRLNEH